MLALLVAADVATSGASRPPSASCAFDAAAMLKLSPYDFDQTSKGWRSIAKPECNVAAADLIATYRLTNWSKFTNNDVAISYFHEGQSRAMAGQIDLAIPLLLAGVNPGATGVSADAARAFKPFAKANAEYALATVAFLQRDLAALKVARARLSAIPEPPEYKEVFKAVPASARAPAAKWPPNLNVVDGLIACFGKPYEEAYYGCRPK